MTSITSAETGRDDPLDVSLRPTGFSEFIGQAAARANLEVFIEAAKQRKAALDHVLFVGPPGLGKTTLAQIVARELGVGFRATSGPVIAKAGDLAALLTNLEDRDVLFIDEIHRLNPAIEEILYPAMEDYQLDLIIGEGPAARSVRIDLAKFTLIGATTRAGLLTTPLRDRFGIPIRLNFYTPEELVQIVERGARLLGVGMAPDGAMEIARRSRGTPRIAGRLLRRVTDFALVDGAKAITRAVADKALLRLDVDARGLDMLDRRYLKTIAEHYGGGPVGIETMAASLSEPRDALEEIVEPYLIQQGFIQRTPRGRMLTALAFQHLGMTRAAGFHGAPGQPVRGANRGRHLMGHVERHAVQRHNQMICFDDGADRFQMRAAGIAIRDGRVLVQNIKGNPTTFIPGGRIDQNESSIDTVVREIEEEFGRTVEVGPLLFVIESFYPAERAALPRGRLLLPHGCAGRFSLPRERDLPPLLRRSGRDGVSLDLDNRRVAHRVDLLSPAASLAPRDAAGLDGTHPRSRSEMSAAHRFEVRVYYEDTDFSGNVYHAAYLHFFERARTEFLRAEGIHHSELAKEGIAFAVRSMEIDFAGAAHIDDLLDGRDRRGQPERRAADARSDHPA